MRKSCAACGREFEAKRKNGKYCGATCRVRAHRKSASTPPVVPEVADLPTTTLAAGAVTGVTQVELEGAGRVETSAGQAALALARRIDASNFETGSSMAALVREYRATLADAVKDAQTAVNPLDELRTRRERRLGRG